MCEISVKNFVKKSMIGRATLVIPPIFANTCLMGVTILLVLVPWLYILNSKTMIG